MEIFNNIAGSFMAIAVIVVLLVLAVFWVIFPWMVYAQLKDLLKATRQNNSELSQLKAALTVANVNGGQVVTNTHRLAEFFSERNVKIGH